VVIGAGIGGLTAAALLAKAGLDVCVLEMDARPGGYLAGFKRKKFIFDTAIHWLNQCGPGGMVRRVLDFVGPGAPPTPQLRRIRRYKGESFDYTLTDDPDQLRDQLIADNPDEADAITRFFAVARKIGDAFELMSSGARARETMSALEQARYGMRMAKVGLIFGRWVATDTETAFRKHFPSKALERMFCSEHMILSCLTPIGWAYHGDYQIPPAGGSLEFPRFLVDAIQSFGSRVIYRARVEKIHVEGKRARAVELVHGTRDPQRHTIECDWVLAACDLETVYERMLPEGAIPQSTIEKLRDAELYDSCVSIALGLDVPTQALGFDEELVMLTRDDVSRKAHNEGDPHESAISILAPSLRDPTMAPSDKGTLTLLTTANIEYGDRWRTGPDFERGPEYEAFKQAYADVVIDRVAAALCPNLREHIEICDVATPITHRRYTGNRDGTIMAAKPSRANIRNDVAHYVTPIENLLLSSHWAEYGGGVPVAVRAGANSALLVLKREKPGAFAILRDVLDAKREPGDVDPEHFKQLTPA
jgi:prolycopene isomerase